jgi:hypothetical protein
MTVTAHREPQALGLWTATPVTEEEHLRLVLADEDFLRKEFQAIIAAVWRAEPPRRPRVSRSKLRLDTARPPRLLRDRTSRVPRGFPAPLRREIRAHERSPPRAGD